MRELPKVAMARLKAKPEALKTPGAAAGPDGGHGADHPDANLLAAFVEKALRKDERTQVLNHLAQCAECRRITAFVLPAVPESVREASKWIAAAHRTRRIWIAWPILRWGAMTAVLGALATVVVVHPGLWKGHSDELSKATPPAAAGSIARASLPPAPSASAASEPAPAMMQAGGRSTASIVAELKKAPPPLAGPNREEESARAAAKQAATLMAEYRRLSTSRVATSGDKVRAEGERSAAENIPSPAAPPLSRPPSSPAGETVIVSAEAGKLSVERHSGDATSRATSGTVATDAGNAGAGPAETTVAQAAPRRAVQPSARMMAVASSGAMHATRKGMTFVPGAATALWSVAPDGKVQRSTDGGKTFEQITVAQGIELRAIAALGNEVWTGGTGGAVFHSVDGGATWSRVAITVGGNTVTETIASIQLLNPWHLTITTASGTQWVSEDSGQHWQKKP